MGRGFAAVMLSVAMLAPCLAAGAPAPRAEAERPALVFFLPHPARNPVRLAAPDAVRNGRVAWRLDSRVTPVVPVSEAWFRGGVVTDSLAFWRSLVSWPYASPAFLRMVAKYALAGGDTLAADSVLASPALTRSIWAWPALRQRAEIALARGDTARADSVLERASRDGWPDSERAAWLLQRARLRLALRDTALALEFGRQTVRVYPSMGSAPQTLSLVESLVLARGDSLGADEERAAAEVEAFRGNRAAAARRLTRAMRLSAPDDRGASALRLATIERGARHFVVARSAASLALQLARDGGARADALLELARTLREDGKLDSALAAFDSAFAAAPDTTRRFAALWEAARASEFRARWDEARLSFERAAALGTRRSPDASFRAGLMQLTSGRADSALAAWGARESEAAEFWWGVTARAVGKATRDGLLSARGDSVLAALGARPGYLFYRTAARDTLRLRGWPGELAAEHCFSDSTFADVYEAGLLVGLGLDDEAAFLLSRSNAGDPRTRMAASTPSPLEWLAAASEAYRAARINLAIAIAERAQRENAALGPELEWRVVPWAYPPGYESLFRAMADSLHLEPALLWAVARQESRFDPAARSSSGALGLMQLLLPAAQDAARWAKERKPTEATMLDPASNVKLGARYLARLVTRFDGLISVALSAYNAGPSTIPDHWRELIARGGEALFCEIASNADAQDYTRKILANRQGYRELKPFVAR